MKIVIQRVSKAEVKTDNKKVSKIKQGLLLLIGWGDNDRTDSKMVEKICKKILNMRIFADQQDKMNLSIQDIKGELLVVPEFTLLAETTKGNRPFFGRAASAAKASLLFEKFISELKKSGLAVKSGIFGAKMQVNLINDGPVTIILEY